MAGKSINSFGSKNFAPGPPATRYNVSGKNREFYTYENAPGIGAGATGGTIIDGGDGYIYHIFTGTGTFAIPSNTPSTQLDSVDYLIVGGGGSTLNSFGAGGGGGGGFLFGNISVPQTSYPIVVGAAGALAPGTPGTPRNGSLSSAFGISAAGGGGGGAPPPSGTGGNGGSGGGGSSNTGGSGAGNIPATIPRQGYPGGQGGGGPAPASSGAGGGGAGGLGGAGAPPPGAAGGSRGLGRIAPEFPSTIVRKAIPAPALPSWEPLVGPEGYAGGGGGSPFPGTPRGGPDNSGYGGDVSLLGGSGIVCIRYKKTAPYTRATGGTVEPSTDPTNGHPGVWRHIFTSPGDFTVTDPTLQYIEYLAVGGGGGGGQSSGPGAFTGGGGGAGGFVSSIHTSTTTPTSTPQAYPWNLGYSVQVAEQYPVGVSTYPISVGAGGASGTAGSNTTIGNSGPSQIIAAGGGRGGFQGLGGAGGSGGGGAAPGPSPGGSATPSPLIQGNPGGAAPTTPAPVVYGAGGGGAGAAAATGPSNGGVGWYSVLSPSSYGTPGPLTPNPLYRYFAGGGGTVASNGGAGGGGGLPGVGVGITNTGGGGGGGGASPIIGGAGGSGIVIIQYPE